MIFFSFPNQTNNSKELARKKTFSFLVAIVDIFSSLSFGKYLLASSNTSSMTDDSMSNSSRMRSMTDFNDNFVVVDVVVEAAVVGVVVVIGATVAPDAWPLTLTLTVEVFGWLLLAALPL